MKLPSLEEVSAAFQIVDGQLVWRHGRKHASQYGGKPAGCLDKHGYVVLSFQRRQFRAHRLVWLLVNEKWPTMGLDHINGDKADNRIENLREANLSQNMWNRKPDSGCKYKGAWRLPNGKFTGRVGGKYTGLFDTEEEAARAYDAAAKARFGEFARLNFPQER